MIAGPGGIQRSRSLRPSPIRIDSTTGEKIANATIITQAGSFGMLIDLASGATQ